MIIFKIEKRFVLKSEKVKKIIIGILNPVLILGITITILSKLNKKNTINANGKTFDSEYKLTDNDLQLLGILKLAKYVL